MESPEKTRVVLDQSASGAPAAGRAVRDLFSTDEIFQRIIATADEEFSRSARLLFLSGLAAGLSIGLSFVARAAMTAAVPSDTSGLVGNLLYPIGFLLIVIGRYQLYTENTLTPVTLVLTRIASLPLLLRVWGIVLAANLLGAALTAYVLATTGVFDADTAEVARAFGEHALETPWNALFWKGIFAGWLVASMVWLTHAARDTTARVFIVMLIMYLVPSADLFHCIIGACEVLYLAFQGYATYGASAHFFAAVVLGNTVGGVVFVAILNFAQTREARFPERDCGQMELTWREWLLGRYSGATTGRPAESRDRLVAEAEQLDPPVGADDHARGEEKSAPVTLVQYGDYECPTSRKIYLLAERVRQHAPGEVRYVYRHLPLSQRHPHATDAAIASEAAAEQGDFWTLHDALFSHQDALETADLLTYARDADLDAERFETDLLRNDLRERVAEDRRAALQSGVRGTRNLFVNGVRYQGAFTFDDLLQRVEQEIDVTEPELESA